MFLKTIHNTTRVPLINHLLYNTTFLVPFDPSGAWDYVSELSSSASPSSCSVLIHFCDWGWGLDALIRVTSSAAIGADEIPIEFLKDTFPDFFTAICNKSIFLSSFSFQRKRAIEKNSSTKYLLILS